MASLLNVNMTDLVTLNRKGVLRYVNSLYNPGEFFDAVHIVTRNPSDFNLPLDGSIKLHHVHDYHNPVLNLLSSTHQMARIVHKEGIDIIRGRGPFQSGWQAVKVGWRTKRPVVVSCGGDYRLVHEYTNEYELKLPWLTDMTEEFVLKHADRIFVYNNFSKLYCISRGAPAANIRIVPQRVDLSFFNPQRDGTAIRREYLLGDCPIVLFVGIMNEYNQVDSVARIVPLVLLKEPRAKFVFVGGGPLSATIQQQLRHCRSQVLFLDYQPQERIAQLMAAATVVLVPMSVFVLLEAAASARPIVAYDIEWHSEFVKDYVTGRLIENRNEQYAAEAIVELIRDEGLAKRLGSAARRKMEREFNEADLIAREVVAYKELL